MSLWSGGIPPRKKTQTKPKVVHAYVFMIADAIHASAEKIEKVKSGVSLRCDSSIRWFIRRTFIIIRLCLGKLLGNLLQVAKRTINNNTPIIP